MLGPLRRSLAREWLDIELPVGPDFMVRIVERPGLWQDAPARAALRDELVGVARRALGDGELDYGVLDPCGDALERTVVTCVRRREDGLAVAFNALPIFRIELDGRSHEVQHLGLVVVDPAYHGRGFSWVLYGLTCFLLFLRRRMRPMWISSVTQVPAVVGMVAETFSDVFPDPVRDSRPSFVQRQIARAIMRDHRAAFGVAPEAGFDEGSFIIDDAYTGGSDDLKKTFEEAPAHRDTRYGDYCRARLDYARGDDVLQIGRIDLATFARYLRRVVPGRTLGPLLVRAAVLLLRHVTLPLLHWLDAAHPFGRLRPW